MTAQKLFETLKFLDEIDTALSLQADRVFHFLTRRHRRGPGLCSKSIDDEVANVARDPKLNVPKKLSSFPAVAQDIKEMAIGYNRLRNALEHHHDLPKADIRLSWRRAVFTSDAGEITSLPARLPASSGLSLRFVDEDKVYSANQKIVLEPEATYNLAFTLHHVIGRSFFSSMCVTPSK